MLGFSLTDPSLRSKRLIVQRIRVFIDAKRACFAGKTDPGPRGFLKGALFAARKENKERKKEPLMPTARWKTPVVSKGQQHNEPALYSAHSRMSEMKFGSGHSLSMGAPLSCPMPGVFVASQLSLLWRAPFPPQTNKQPTNLKTEEINYKCLDRK